MISMKLIFTILIFATSVVHTQNAIYNTTLWSNILEKYVALEGTPDTTLNGIHTNTVNYSGIAQDKDFPLWLELINNTKVDGLTKTEFYAFFINVYNTFAIDMIIKHKCEQDIFGYCGALTSINDIGTIIPYNPVWKMPAGLIDGREWTLDDVENYLRRIYQPPWLKKTDYKEDPRLHSCIVCASISCPSLRNSAYTVENLNNEMAESFTYWLKNKKKGLVVDKVNNKIQLSTIFDWFGSDFINFYDPKPETVLKFILDNVNNTFPDYEWINKNKNSCDITFFKYDWDVNTKPKELGCDSTDRPCFRYLELTITIGILVFATLIVIAVLCVRRRQKKKKMYNRISLNK